MHPTSVHNQWVTPFSACTWNGNFLRRASAASDLHPTWAVHRWLCRARWPWVEQEADGTGRRLKLHKRIEVTAHSVWLFIITRHIVLTLIAYRGENLYEVGWIKQVLLSNMLFKHTSAETEKLHWRETFSKSLVLKGCSIDCAELWSIGGTPGETAMTEAC